MNEIEYIIRKGAPESLSTFVKLSEQDQGLIQSLNVDRTFSQSENRLEAHFYSLDGRLLKSISNLNNYTVLAGGSKEEGSIEDIVLKPDEDIVQAGFSNGDVNVLYNFINNLYTRNNTRPSFFIESISPDRREIRALSNRVSQESIIEFTNSIKQKLNTQEFFEDFRLNFGSNLLPIAINIESTQYRDNQAVLIRLYEPLPLNIAVKDTFLIEELVGDSVLYQVVTEVTSTDEQLSFSLRGPNYDIPIVEENNNPTGYLNYNELFSYPVSNSYYEVYSLFNEKSAQISIDHTDFNEFIHFSSAEERVRNFYYKVGLVESYSQSLAEGSGNSGKLQALISGTVSNFDHYERYLYYETGSFSWPKSSSTRPYQLYSTGSSEAVDWYNRTLTSASNYDSQNLNKLSDTVPSFIRDDSNNAPYLLFVDMIGQHFDNLWIYMKGVTEKYNADNRLDYGISKDLVRDAIENFGITLYNNNEALENLFGAFVGESYNSGSEVISSLITAVEGSGSLSGSEGNRHLQPMPKSSYQKEVYKRIYHNIPLLLKSKGTERGIRALINSFGIPSDILDIKVFGGGAISDSLFFGPSTEFTSSLDKIRITNTDTVLTGSTLSNYTTVNQPGKDYSIDLHTIDVGFSPTDGINRYIKAHPSMSSFNLDEYIGDPGLAYSGSYKNLDALTETVFTSGSSYTEPYDLFDFVRLIKFFDNSIFRIIKEFVPARSNVNTGIVIKPHLLDRSKIKQPEAKWSNQTSPAFTHSTTELDYTGSFYTTNFSVDGEVDTAFITGSTGLGSIDSASYSYTETYANPSGGYQTLLRNNHDESAYTGELSGSNITISSGDLNLGNNFRKIISAGYNFNFFPSSSFTDLTSFIQSDYSITDNITLWISQSIVSNYTSSAVEALAIPRVSSNAGNITSILENATEVVFNYVKFTIEDNYTTTSQTIEYKNTIGQDLQDHNASIVVQQDPGNLTHNITFSGDTVGNAPYSASLTVPLPDIDNGTQVDIPFNYSVLHTSQGGTISELRVELRNSLTSAPYPNMSFLLDMDNLETGNTLLTFVNNSTTLQNVEFFFQVFVETVGNPPNNIPGVNITGLQAIYKGDGEGYYQSGISSRKRLKDAYYYKLEETITIPTSSITLGQTSSDQYLVGFLPETNELFRFNDYNSVSNNVDSVRKSRFLLTIDEEPYTPTQGNLTGSLLPGNYEIISSSLVNGLEGLDDRFFAEIQDSNYYFTGWKNARYDGTEATNRRRGVRVLGLEPSRTFNSFNSYEFLDTATTASIKSLVKSIDDAAGKDRQDLTVYYNRYESKLLGDVLTSFNSVGGGAAGSATLNTSNVNSFGVTVDGLSQGLYNWSGSIGEYTDGGRVQVNFNVRYDFWTDDEISGSLAPVSPGTRTPSEFTISLVDLDNGGVSLDSINTLFSDGVFVGKPDGYGDEYNYTFTLQSDVVSKNVAIKFQDSNLYEESGGTTGVTFTFNTIKKSNFIPVNNPSGSITAETPEIKTFFYREVPPTPSSPSGFETITNSKLYRLDTDQVFTTDDRGIVVNIE